MKKWEKNKPLAEFSTFGIGGIADYFVSVETIEELQEVLAACWDQKIAYHVLGKGSNSLFSDKGFSGLIIQNKIQFCEIKNQILYVGAGFSFSLLGVKTARLGLSGLEFASGIPASVGGAIFMNAGADGSETSEVIQEVLFVNERGERQIYAQKDLHFSYRFSSFQTLKGVIAAAKFCLRPSAGARQKQLDLIAYRTKTQPYGALSCGCIFRNPLGANAGALIEKCGLKGKKMGGAKVSEKHANFIINDDEATAEDVLNLAEYIREVVKGQTGYDLEMELRTIPNE